MFSEENKVIVRGRENLSDEKRIVEDVIENIGEMADRELNPVRLSSWEPDNIDDEFSDYYNEMRDNDWLESEVALEDGGIEAGNLSRVLMMQPIHDNLEGVPVMHVTNQPLFVEERKTEEIYFVHGVTTPGDYNSSAVVSMFPYQEMNRGKKRNV